MMDGNSIPLEYVGVVQCCGDHPLSTFEVICTSRHEPRPRPFLKMPGYFQPGLALSLSAKRCSRAENTQRDHDHKSTSNTLPYRVLVCL